VIPAPRTETIDIRLTEHEHSLIEEVAALRGMPAGDLVLELIGFERSGEGLARHLRLVPTKGEGGGRPGARACLP
jgi:uncharacterized protein (DUF1778 family)